MSARDLLSIQNSRRKAIADLQTALADAFLVMPTAPITAPVIAPLEADDKLFHEVNLRTLRNTMLGNNLRLCGLAQRARQTGTCRPASSSPLLTEKTGGSWDLGSN
jgi:aspartyl-tRNA(Asn)/glutamyl-tRNA(Gln) amidotransferase subunit A